ncbi:MAG: hypothetical protein JNN27_17880 [Planctomycetes bacterium]|nr:hypothetical protein [Planctomycetota bacterium]
MTLKSLQRVLMFAAAATPLSAQVHYYGDGRPWSERASEGPDAEVPGWFYNLGRTGLRVELVADAPTHLVVRHVFKDSPAHGRVEVGDHIVGVHGKRFETPHRNGYGMEVFGPQGPLLDFAEALEACQSKSGEGRLELMLERNGKPHKASLTVGTNYGEFAPSYPAECKKSERILAELLEQLVAAQRDDGSFWDPVTDTFAPLALLASGKREHLAAAERNARYHARTTKAVDEDSLINWRYMTAGIVLSEFHAATGEEWVVKELEEVRDFLMSSQYMSLDQVNPQSKVSHPDSYPKNALQQRGGWGHIQGFEGYGPIAMLTGQGALTLALMHHCGVKIDRERLDAATAFLERGAGSNGYVWYADDVAGDKDWADMGRTGAAGIALHLHPWPDTAIKSRARKHSLVIGEHPLSFPDTHGSPIMGMGYAALAANIDPANFRSLMDANRWWFTLSQCTDGSFYYQPNRDNAGYGADSRLSASAVTAFIFSIPKRNLLVTGRKRGG